MVVIQPALAKALNDRLYDKQRAATIKIERLVLEALDADDEQRIYGLLAELSTDYATSEKEAARIGGLVALAATAVALTHINIRPFLPHIVPPIVSALSDGESKVRYFACESLYNVAKVSRGHILRWFNDIFDGLARVTADSVKTVKDGADYLDRLIKDIVAEQAATCLDWYEGEGAVAREGSNDDDDDDEEEEEGNEASQAVLATPAEEPQEPARGPRLAFSLDKFMPLLSERMHTYKPSTRLYLIEWIRVLDSVPGLDVIGYLPEFLGGLLRFLSDPNDDVRNKTQSLLGELLNEMAECVELQHMDDDGYNDDDYACEGGAGGGARMTMGQRGGVHGQRVHASGRFTSPSAVGLPDELGLAARRKRIREERTDNASLLVPGAQVAIEFAQVIEILIPHLESNDLEIQGTALGWVYQLTWLCPQTVVRHVPRLVNAVLPSVSHPMATHRHTAEDVNVRLSQLVRDAAAPTRLGEEEEEDAHAVEEPLNYDHAATAIMELFAKNVHEPTKVAGMQWLLLLHGKAPWRILTPEDMSFPVLLKMLSDSSEQVVRLDLELFAQISLSNYDEDKQHVYLRRFLGSLLQMFATDRVLLETRVALMVRQLCAVLDPQLVFCIIAEQLCEEERADLEFVSVMVQHMSWILVTAPETESLRRILRGYNAGLPLEMPQLRPAALTTAQQQQQVLQQVLQRGKQQQQQQQRAGRTTNPAAVAPVDTQRMDRMRQTLAHAVQRIQCGVEQNKRSHALFVQLFSAWCHNPAACLTLCLLSQHYETGAELVCVFGQLPLDLTVSFLVQLDKLVQLIESPVFTFLRLQLLDPGEQPLLLRTLYGLLMLLPQSSAFAILRNRLGSVGGMASFGGNGPAVRASSASSGDLDHDQAQRNYTYNYHYHVHRHSPGSANAMGRASSSLAAAIPGIAGIAGTAGGGGAGDLRRIVQLLTATEQSHQSSLSDNIATSTTDGPFSHGSDRQLPTAAHILQQMAELQLCQPSNKDDDYDGVGASGTADAGGGGSGGGCACGCLHCCPCSPGKSNEKSSIVDSLVAEYRSVRQRHTQAVMRSRGQHKQG
ncbi:hypothetical protein GGI23_000158 [Coemansia sp. RSA 2559]|nr:hypothetical protein GGI23_000158 [Coemansia sp. RSA 2559]KAJ2869619.1 hypothetical protein GGI22_000137 [Coemansia erecta]